MPTIKEIRRDLGKYLTKRANADTGIMSTQNNVSVTSVTAGGVQGKWRFGTNGQIIVNDGTNDRVLIGKLTQ